MKKILALTMALIIVLCTFASCGTGSKNNEANSGITIGVPNDTTNEARALLLLQQLGIIKLKDGVDIKATVKDIAENPYNVKISEIEAAQLPNVLQDLDYAVINSNYAIDAGLNPVKNSLGIEDSSAAYANIIAVKAGNEKNDKTKALVAALESNEVKEYILQRYNGSVVSTIDNPGTGYDSSVDYSRLSGKTIKIAASPTPHAEILEVAKKLLARKNIILEVTQFTDYVQPNNVVESGEFDANYFQHTPYLDDFNAENGTHIVSVAAIHNEPLGIYGGKQSSLEALKNSK